MEYTNYLTTPSGRYCLVKDINNGEYLILVKFLQALNHSKFFECMDEIVKKSIPDFDDCDILEKCYIYIAMCMYSIRAVIGVNNTMLGTQEIPLSIILNNIENCYTRDFVAEYNLSENVTLKFGYPKKFYFEGETPTIDFFSGLIGYNSIVLTDEQKLKLKSKLDTKTLIFIDDFLREKCSTQCDIFQGIPMNKFIIDIFSLNLIVNVLGFFKMPLESFYHVMYAMIKHLRMSYNDFLKISQLETSILLKLAALENSKMSLEAKNGNISTIGRALDD